MDEWNDIIDNAVGVLVERIIGTDDEDETFVGQHGFLRSVQLDTYSCGARCAYAVLRHYGHRVGYDALKTELGTNLWDGTEEGPLVKALRRRGFRVKPYARMYMRHLERALSAGGVAIVEVDGNHYAAVYGMSRDGVYVADPSLVRAADPWHSRKQFRDRWDRAGMTVIP